MTRVLRTVRVTAIMKTTKMTKLAVVKLTSSE